ncbi:MAG: hypothetical protein PHS80_00015 [Methanothrix sp.]|nr:hypothetical protein [Bacteroidales bacterium]MDD2753884.1 hypothetical protein [Methanothrix sp.]
MKLTAKTEIIKEFIGIADGINVEELRVHVEEDKIWYLTVDTANVALALVEIPKDAFTEFDVIPSTFCLDMDKFKVIFGFGGKEISIIRDTVESNSIVVESGGYRSVQTLLHDGTVKKDPNMPGFELPGKVEMVGKDLASIITNISKISDKIRFVVADGKFTVKSEAEGQDNTEKVMHGDELLHIGGDGNSMFSADYLIGMSRNFSGDIGISIGVDHPIILEFGVSGGRGTGKYLLAPRIEGGE